MTAGAATWLTAAQAAEYLGLPSAAALRKRLERGLPVRAYRLGRELRFKRAELDALMEKIGGVADLSAPGESGTREVRPGAARRTSPVPQHPGQGANSASAAGVGSPSVSVATGGEIR